MSKTIDERVVEMRFDNSRFEKNVQTSMSTLDKLKQKLNLTGASKGLENVNAAAKNFNLSGMGTAIETVHSKFSALEIMGITALANITNSAVNAGKRIVSALTFEPVTTGFQEYETQINAVQTILANTQSKGSTLEDVNKALDELNTYADKTIYNFTEMTRNIGTFTAAGVDLDKSVTSIKGIANLAAVSGSTSQQASTAMYQLSQALAAGKVQLMDWNSVVNAGMGGELFQNALKRTAKQMGYNVDEMIKKYGSFRESLTKGEWLTSEVLTETLTQLSGAYTKADLIAQGYTEKQAEEITKLADTAVGAATEVKTFTQLWDTLKEAAQSGWTQSWEIIIGDFEEAKSLLTGVSKFFGNIIDNISTRRNKILEGALSNNPFSKLEERINKVTGATDKMKKATKDYGDVVNKVIGGKFGNGQERIDALTKAGYDWAHVQNLVNEKLGDSTRHATKYKESQKELNKTQAKTIEDLVKLSDEQLKNLGFTKSEIEAFRELQEQSEKTGIPIKKLVKDMDQLNGRTLLINSFKNAGSGLIGLFTAIRNAWKEIFPPMTSDKLYDIIAGFHKLSTNLRLTDEKTGELTDTAKKLQRTFKGLFAILDIVSTITGGALKIGFKVLSKILDTFDMDILDVTASIGDSIVKFRDWVDSTLDLTKALEKISPYLKDAAESIRAWTDGLKETDNIPKYIVSGLLNGLISGTKLVVDIIIELGKSILDGIKGVLGIHSPSTEFFEIGKNIIQGLVNGIQNGSSKVWDTLKNIGKKCIEIFKNIDFGQLLAAGLGVGIFLTIKKLVDILGLLAAPAEALANMLNSIGSMFNGIGDNFRAKALEKKSKAILNFAIAIGILAASVYALSKIKSGDLWESIGAIAVLAAIIIGLSFAVSKLNSIGDLGKQSLIILGIGAALLFMSMAMKKLASIDSENMGQAVKAMSIMVLELCAVMIAFGKFVKTDQGGTINKAGSMLIKMSVALLIMTLVMKQASKLEDGAISKGIGVVIALELLFAGVIAVSKLAGKNATKAGGMLLMMSVAFLIMIGLIKIISKLKAEEILKGISVIAVLEILFAGVIAVSKLAGQHATKAGAMLLQMSIALAIIVSVIKQIGKLDGKDIAKGIGVITLLEVLFAGVIAISKLAGPNAVKAGMMLLLMSGALLAVTAVLFMIKKMDPSGLGRALAIVSVLEILFGGLIAVTHLAEDCKGTLITLAVVVGLLVAAVIGLTFIDPQKLAVATACLSAIMGVFAMLVASTKLVSNFASMAGPVLLLTGVVVILAGIIVALAQLDTSKALTATISLSVLLLTMSGALGILSVIGPTAMASVGALALVGLVVGELAIILGLMSKFNVNPSIETASALSILLLSMSGALAILSAVGVSGPAAFIGIGALATLIAGIGGLITGIGYLVTKFPQLEEFLNTGIPILSKIGEAIGSFFGNIVDGFISEASEGLVSVGTNLSAFMEEAKGFIEGAKTIDETALSGISSLAKIILTLTAADILSGITSFIAGGNSMETFAAQLTPFGEALCEFSKVVSGNIDETAVASAANAGKIMAELASNIPRTGPSLFSLFAGDNSLTSFGYNLEMFGSSIVSFSKVVSQDGAINETAVQAAANAGSIMASLAKDIPRTGPSLFSLFAGDNSLASFGYNLEMFGSSIVSFSKAVSQDGGIDEKAVQAAANAGAIMVALAKDVPRTGPSLFSIFAGDNSLTSFGYNLEMFGSSIAAFSKTVSQDGAINEEAIQAAANAGAIMVELQNTIPNTGGVVSWFTGDNSLDSFGSKILSFGQTMVDFSKAVSGNIDTAAVTSVANVGKMMVTLQKSLPEDGWFDDKMNLEDFGGQLVSFGESVSDYSKSVNDVKATKLSTIASGVKTIVATIKNMAGMDTSGISTFKKAIEELSKISFDKLTKNFSESSSKMSKTGVNMMMSMVKGMKSKQSSLTDISTNIIENIIKNINSKKLLFMVAGADIMSNFANGVITQKSKAKSTMTTMLSTMITTARGYHDNFYNAGSYLVSGFADGISENSYKAKAKAKAMAEAAEEAARKALKINSPSKVFIKIGGGVPEGFAKGIDKFGYYVANSMDTLSSNALNETKKAIARIADVIDADMDTQPTIRPVIDLSNVESGAAAIGGMFNNGPSVRLSANVDAINTMMTRNSQNGTNDDIISAIDKLRKDLGNIKGDSYIIDGITYDDGSNISDAVKSLVRAARIERRI